MINSPPGTGKTRAALCLPKPLLFLTFRTIVAHILEECKRINVQARVINDCAEDAIVEDQVVVASYECVGAWKKFDVVPSTKWCTLVLDEVHLVTKRSTLLKSLPQCAFRVGLTATCTQVPVGDQLKVVHGTHSDFIDLQVSTCSLMQRPEPQIELAVWKLSDEEKSRYDQMIVGVKNMPSREMLCKLREARQYLSLLKVNAVADILRKITPPAYKVLIASDFTNTLQALQSALGVERCLRVDAKVPIAKRKQKIDSFFADGSRQYLLGTRETVGFGLDLPTSALVLMEPTRNESEMQQWIGRMTRLGAVPENNIQQKVVVIQYADTLEMNLSGSIKLHNHKQDVQMMIAENS